MDGVFIYHLHLTTLVLIENMRFTHWSLGDVVAIWPKPDYMLHIKFVGTICETALRWMRKSTCDEKSTLVQAMAWCRQKARYYRMFIQIYGAIGRHYVKWAHGIFSFVYFGHIPSSYWIHMIYSIITDLYLFFPLYQRYLKELCTIGLYLIWMNTKFCFPINLVSEKYIQPIWLWWHWWIN